MSPTILPLGGKKTEIEWRVSPQVFSDIHAIFSKHGIGIQMDTEESMAMFGRVFGPDAATLEILEKYKLRAGVPLKVIVDWKMTGHDRPNYED